MPEYIKWIFGETKEDFGQLVCKDTVILDVRSVDEYSKGHIKGSINIPVDQLNFRLAILPDKQKPIITCCASGIRSASAKTILKANGYREVYNAGRWTSLNTE